MWLILTEPYDDTGSWLAEGLRTHLPGAVTHLTTRDIMHRARTAHVAEHGTGWFQVTTENGTTIDSRTLRGVVNRVCALPPGLAFRLRGAQRDAAECNFGLPLLHLLHHFEGPVLNRPTAQGISGDFRLDFEWAALACQVGLPRAMGRTTWPAIRSARFRPGPAPVAEEGIVPVVVVGDQVVMLDRSAPRVPAHAISSCRRLAALSRTTLLGIDLVTTPEDEWLFVRANSRASLVPGGEDALAAVTRALTTTAVREASLPQSSARKHILSGLLNGGSS